MHCSASLFVTCEGLGFRGYEIIEIIYLFIGALSAGSSRGPGASWESRLRLRIYLLGLRRFRVGFLRVSGFGAESFDPEPSNRTRSITFGVCRGRHRHCIEGPSQNMIELIKLDWT